MLNFSSPIAMRNEFSRFRLQHKVAGSKLDKKLALGIPMVKRTPDGKLQKDVANYWINNVSTCSVNYLIKSL